jgi:1-acyl-sn-glycerol-3-phosphate acyltransferase
LAVAALVGYTVVLTPATLFFRLFDGSGRRANDVIRLWGRLLLKTGGIRVEIHGAERMPAGPVIFAANHASYLDIPIMFGGLPCEFRIIYKRSLSVIPFLGWSLWAGRHLAIDRTNPFKAKRCLAQAAERIHGGMSVVAFPEGTRTGEGDLLPFKRGSFVLALDARVPVVPVSIIGAKQRMPNGLGSIMPGTVSIRIHDPIPTEGRPPENGLILAEETRAIVRRGLFEV